MSIWPRVAIVPTQCPSGPQKSTLHKVATHSPLVLYVIQIYSKTTMMMHKNAKLSVKELETF